MKILIFGPQGSGKTTQARILAEKMGYYLLSSGDLAREKAQEDSEEGRGFKKQLTSGKYVDDEAMGNLVRLKLKSCASQKGWVSDAYPRSLAQLKSFNPEYDVVFYLNVSEKEAIDRLLKRGRTDDTPELIRNRLDEYHKLTKPVLEYYRETGKLVELLGNRSIEEIAADIEAVLERKRPFR